MDILEMTGSAVNNISSYFSLAIYIAAIVARWNIFSRCGEAGWEAIIPFYNTYTYGKLADRVKASAGIIITNILLTITLSAGIILIVLGLFTSMSETGIDSEILETGSAVTGTGLALLMVTAVLSIIRIVLVYKLYSSFARKIGQSNLWGILFVFSPGIAEIILGFFMKNSWVYQRSAFGNASYQDTTVRDNPVFPEPGMDPYGQNLIKGENYSYTDSYVQSEPYTGSSLNESNEQ